MQKWEAVLRRDSEAWESFQAWLRAIADRETQRMLSVGAADHDRQRGKIEGVIQVLFEATANEREELSRARREA